MTPRPHRPRRNSQPPPAALPLFGHPFELATLVLLGVSALNVTLSPDLVRDVLDPVLAFVWVATITVGVVLTLAGMFVSVDPAGKHPTRAAFGRALEKAGLYLLAGVAAAYLVIIQAAIPFADAWPSDVQLGAIAAACVFRAGAIRRAERIALEVLTAKASRSSGKGGRR